MTIHALKKVLKYRRQFQSDQHYFPVKVQREFSKRKLFILWKYIVHLYLTETGEVERFISSATMVIAEEVLIVEDL